MGVLGFLWDAYQQNQISGTQRNLDRAVSDARFASGELRTLETRVEQLALVNMALWSMVRERFGLTETDLAKRVEEIDLSDGRLDGRYTAPARTCSSCRRKMAAHHQQCIYCGGTPLD